MSDSQPPTVRPSRVALLLFGSGACALVYEIAWLREFRLVFGASTAANAAVLAVFIGGLGAGGAILGRRADRVAKPIVFYARLEALVAGSAALTPLLIWIARKVYIALGGTLALGSTGAAAARLALTAVVLAVPTFLMGGTLPAAARGIETDDDSARRRVGLLYGFNTLGAVAGCILANFLLLENFGTRATLLIASFANFLVSRIAWSIGRAMPEKSPSSAEPTAAAAASGKSSERAIPAWFVLVASAAVGFAFFLMEIVWYRMLGPLLGGTVFTFGVILAVALLGIGLGGACYTLIGAKIRPTLGAFALSCVLEGALIAFPYALGDRLAMLATLLRPLGWLHFGGLVAGWTTVTMLVVLLPSFVAGAQFPLLIAMLGKGGDRVGEQTGLAYAANTGGAILGALAGGFGLLPALSALGAWRLVAWLLSGLAIVAALLVVRRRESWLAPLVSAALVLAIGAMLGAEGPTSAWRHSPIGVGRIPPEVTSSQNSWHAWMNTERRAVRWERDGVESTVALQGRMGWAFVVNGKSDGHVRIDAPTQVMLGILGAILHPGVKRAMVIGLGSGSTAGWLGAVPDIERVDVAELEPAMLHVADVSAAANRDALHNPRVHILLGDAREVLLTTRSTYELVVSEPSNPYRAGVASLFTQEYYQAIRERLSEDGLFLQWLQAYAIDVPTMRTVYATIGAVFPEIETWELGANDLVLVASRKPVRYDLPRLRDRVTKEPYRAALLHTWRTAGIEGLFSHYIARGTFARALAHSAGPILNTDDRSIVEFAFARTARDFQGGSVADVRDVARTRGEQVPRLLDKHVDWERSTDEWLAFRASEGAEIRLHAQVSEPQRVRAYAFAQFASARFQDVIAQWRSQPRDPSGPTELAVLALANAELADDAALGYVEGLRAFEPVEADAILARLRLRQGKLDQATDALVSAFTAYRTDVWPWPIVMNHALETAKELGQRRPLSIAALHRSLAEPFACSMLDEGRNEALLTLARSQELDPSCVEALRPFEPYFPWIQELLAWRAQCYDLVHHAEAARANRELKEFTAAQPITLGEGLGGQ